jgi:phosphatidylglycerophosphate synthase
MQSPPTALRPEPPVAAGGVARRATFKPYDVEELLDDRINRPLARLLVKLLAPLPITPNQVTILSGVAGLAAGILIGFGSPARVWLVPLGGAVLFLSILLDCADGQLARLRGTSSMVGRALDGYVDVVPTAAAFVGFAVFLWRAGYSPLMIHALGWTAGFSMKWHVHRYDHAKNVYLHNVLDPSERGTTLPTAEQIERERQLHLARGDRFGAFILRGFAQFTESQRRGWQGERMGLTRPAMADDHQRTLYRERFVVLMRLWTFNGLATHLALFLVAAALTPVYAYAVTVAWWLMIVPLNLMTLALLLVERRVERRLALELGREAT